MESWDLNVVRNGKKWEEMETSSGFYSLPFMHVHCGLLKTRLLTASCNSAGLRVTAAVAVTDHAGTILLEYGW